MKNLLCGCLAVLVAFSMSGVSVEAKEAKNPEAIFKMKDKNGDGQLTLQEFTGKVKKKAAKKENKKKPPKKNNKKADGKKKKKNS